MTMSSKRNPEHDHGDFVSFFVYKPFVPHELDAELAEEHGWEKCDINIYGNPSEASEEEPVIIWVSNKVNDRKFKRILDQHGDN